MNNTKLNLLCGIVQRATDRLSSEELTAEQHKEVLFYVNKLNQMLWNKSPSSVQQPLSTADN